jgi:glycosyltransferase involved in cell wall biosynthesis
VRTLPTPIEDGVKVLYLTNLYPKQSHTFIRREIHGVEAAGLHVERVSIRPSDDSLVDEVDRLERERTRVILHRGVLGLVLPTLKTLVTRPWRSLRALRTAVAFGVRSPRGLARHFAYFAESCVLLQWTRELGIEHVHAHFATNPVDVALLCRELGGPPFSFTAHGTADLGSPSAVMLPRKLEAAEFAVAVCQDGRRKLLLRSPPGHEDKLHVVRCGVEAPFLVERPRSAESTPRFVCVARLSPEKDHINLLHAARALADEGLSFELDLIGDGPERSALEALTCDLALGDRVHFEGWRSGEDVLARIAQSHALVLASWSEGLPVVIMEALALRRPVVSTDVGGIRELVEPGRSGWLVPPRSPSELAHAMREALLSDVDVLDEMGRHGAARVAEAHDARAQGRVIARLFVDSKNRRVERTTSQREATGILVR